MIHNKLIINLKCWRKTKQTWLWARSFAFCLRLGFSLRILFLSCCRSGTASVRKSKLGLFFDFDVQWGGKGIAKHIRIASKLGRDARWWALWCWSWRRIRKTKLWYTCLLSHRPAVPMEMALETFRTKGGKKELDSFSHMSDAIKATKTSYVGTCVNSLTEQFLMAEVP